MCFQVLHRVLWAVTGFCQRSFNSEKTFCLVFESTVKKALFCISLCEGSKYHAEQTGVQEMYVVLKYLLTEAR